MNEWPCPRCGKSSTGSWSEGGLRWAICEDCMRKDRQEQARRENENWPKKKYRHEDR